MVASSLMSLAVRWDENGVSSVISGTDVFSASQCPVCYDLDAGDEASVTIFLSREDVQKSSQQGCQSATC